VIAYMLDDKDSVPSKDRAGSGAHRVRTRRFFLGKKRLECKNIRPLLLVLGLRICANLPLLSTYAFVS